MDSKVIIALISVGVGWGLSQLTEIVKSKFKNKKLKSALVSELKDVSFYLDKSLPFCDAFVDSLSKGNNVFRHAPLKIKTIVYDNYYPEIYVFYSQSERINISIIYGQIEQLNKALENYDINNSREEYINIYRLILMIKEMVINFFEEPSIVFSTSSAVNDKVVEYRNSIFYATLT